MVREINAFLNLVGQLKPTAGEIFVDGHKVEYSKKGLRNLRRKIGIVFQNSDQQIFYSIVKDDVAFALRNLKFLMMKLSNVSKGFYVN